MDFSSDEAGDSYGDIPTRPMRVKVLYSFDAENKTNCLARFPNTLNIPAVTIDNNSQVGIIELKQCIQAIVAASPDLVSRLSDGDYTIYAFDYSECDTPLVGQGMLSTALTASSAATESEKTMVTGRVCKNMPAIFSNGIKETLEVKLRLVPVPKPAQIDVRKALDTMHGGSSAVSAGFDPNAWNASVQHNKAQHLLNELFENGASQIGDEQSLGLVDDIFGLESGGSGSDSGLQKMMAGVGVAQTPTDSAFGYNPAFSAHPHSAPGSRSGSPMIGPKTSGQYELLRHQSFSVDSNSFADHSRPVSRATVRSEAQSSQHQRQASQWFHQTQQEQPQAETDYGEDGQPRKRAKVMQTDWRGKSSFGSKPGDLRVTAATAASMQMHRPVAKRPAAPGSDLELPPRVPTPVPRGSTMLPHQRSQQGAVQRSMLREASTVESDVMSNFDQFSEGLMSSPEEVSPSYSNLAEGTPQEIPSSPPVFARNTQPTPSSPGLPTLPPTRMGDSGYMSERGLDSGNVVEGFDDDEEDRSPDAKDFEIARQYQSRAQSELVIKAERTASVAPPPYSNGRSMLEMNVELERPGDMNQLPQRMNLDIPPRRRRDVSQGPKGSRASQAKHANTSALQGQLGSDEGQTFQSRRGSLALPSMPAAGSVETAHNIPPKPAPKRRPTKRTRMESYNSEAGSPAPSDTDGRPQGPKRSGSGAPRPLVIKERLEKALAEGGMPQFCTHCGAIETPTWRKLYVKHCEGKPSPLDYVEGEGETIGIETLATDQKTGEVTRFIIRKSMKKTKDSLPGQGFEDRVVCNPCGLWFNKFQNMRPPSKWARKSVPRKSKKQKTTDGQEPATDGVEPQSEAFFTDQVVPEEEPERGDLRQDVQPEGAAVVTKGASRKPPRASSLQPQAKRRASGDGVLNASQLNAALTRQVQSSPVPFNGSQQSPIEVDMTPKPTRRLLFPSPRRDGEVKSLDDNGQASLKATPPSGKGSVEKSSWPLKGGITFESTDVNIFEAFTFDKENVAPDMEMDDELAHLFQGSPTTLFRTPCKTASKTMTPRSHHRPNPLLKTPTPASRRRKPLSPANANVTNEATSHDHDFMTSPPASRYFLRSTPSRQERTPSRQSQQGSSSGGDRGASDITPFTRHLTQMLSDGLDGGAAFTSPSRALDFSDLPTFITPGRALNELDWNGIDDIMSSEFAAFDDHSKGSCGQEGAEGEEA